MRAEATAPGVRLRRRKGSATRHVVRRAVAAVVLLAALGLLLGVSFAGSSARLAAGVHIAGVDVGGLTANEARRLLQRRAERLQNVPVVFTAGEQKWEIRPSRLGLTVDWAAAVQAARRDGDGFRPVRGLRRIGMRVFGTDLAPPTRVYDTALELKLKQIAETLDRPHREAAVKLRGLDPLVVPARTGRLLDRQAAAGVIVRALAAFTRTPVGLPVRVDAPTVTASDLAPAAEQARTALSKPVKLALDTTRWRVPRWRIAGLLDLPRNGGRSLGIGGPGAEAYLGRFARRVGHLPRNADFAVTSTGIRVVPAQEGLVVDLARTKKALLAAVLSPDERVAQVTVRTKSPSRTTAEARAMGITGLVGTYGTIYGGEPNRIHNVQLVARLIDRTLIAPGATFSFNETTGERTTEKGFLDAPVIINGELQTGLGGGVCQVSTTVFNAAYEAGLKITARTNHALYIDHYPLARDATVNYPDLDLRFVNDTPRWLLLRTFVGSSSLTVNLYGTPTGRRVESETAPLVTTGSVPEKRISDPELYAGETVVEEYGSPPRSTSVRRLVYTKSGKLLHDDSWSSYYRGEYTVSRVGTKPRPEPKPEPPAAGTGKTETTPPATTTTGANPDSLAPSAPPAPPVTPPAPQP